MSNERNGDIIPDSKRREAIGALGEDSYPIYKNPVAYAKNVEIVDPQVGATVIDFTGETIIGKVVKGQYFTIFGDVYQIQNEVTASSNKMVGVEIYPPLRDTTPKGSVAQFYPLMEWRKWSEVLETNAIGNLTPVFPQNT